MSEPRVTLQHGRRHSPDGTDPSMVGVEHFVGGNSPVVFQGVTTDRPEYEQFVNGRNADPTDAVPDPSPLSVKLVAGPPNLLDTDGTILQYTQKTVEIIGDVTDVAIGDIVFVLRPEFRFEKDRPCKGHDDAGNYVPCRLYSTGEFVWGQP